MRTTASTKDTTRGYEHAEIEQRFGDLAEGVSRRGELCPKCGGGSSREKTFSVCRSAGRLVFNCYRASCGFRGAVTQGGYRPVPSEGSGQSERIDGRSRYYALGKGPVPDPIKQDLREKYGLEKHQLARGQFHWTTEHSPRGYGRLVMPTMDQEGNIYGYVARKLNNQVGPKTLSFFESNLGAWYACEGSDELVIVEDQLSALRASDYMNSVALLGTNLTEQMMQIIKGTPSYKNVFIALDADAFPLSIRMAHKARPHFRTKVIKLPKDLKDMEEQVLVDTLFEAGVEFYREQTP